MKHAMPVTIILISVFLLTQVFGLFLIREDISGVQTVNGTTVVSHQDTAIGPRPETTGFQSFLYVGIAVFVGTLLVLLIIKYGKANLWKMWFFIAVFLSVSVALGVLISYDMAFFLAFILAVLKMVKKNVLIHNLTEVLMYSGLAVLIAPLFDLKWAFILLAAISIYDMYAVWKSKHMVKMAQFQTQNKLFAGLMIPYERKEKSKNKNTEIELEIPTKPVKASKKSKKKKVESRKGPTNAILGGGDVAFPLIFSGVYMDHLIALSVPMSSAFLYAGIISITATLAITGLFFFAKKEKFYPAMPFITIGCVVGYLITSILV